MTLPVHGTNVTFRPASRQLLLNGSARWYYRVMVATANWNAEQFHQWYSRMPVEKRAQVWDELRSDQKKLYTEWRTFRDFANVAPLDIDPRTIDNREPPEPDVHCLISSKEHYFELGEVTDQALARAAGIAAKQGQDVFAGQFSQLAPLIRIFQRKCAKTYDTNGRPVHLLLHYSVGHQVPHSALLRAEVSQGQQAIMRELQNSPFSSLWLYDGWEKEIIDIIEIQPSAS